MRLRPARAIARDLAIGGGIVAAGLVPMLIPADRPAWLPDRRITPGDIVSLPKEAVCDRGYAGRVRHVTEADKKAAFARYKIPWERRSEFEVDHLVPLAVGGSNAPEQLWPQPWKGPFNAHEKDRAEVRARSLVCKGLMSLEAAQDIFRDDWTKFYKVQGLDRPKFGAAPGEPEPEPDTEGFGPDADDD